MGCNYRIRLAKQVDLLRLPEIERQAARRFIPFGLAKLFSTATTPVEDFEEGMAAGQLWVAADPDDQPVGFALASVVEDHAHLNELDVLPEHGRRGLGTALVETACQWARGAGFSRITLTTLSHIPWHTPFYKRLGFRILRPEECSEIQRLLLSFEVGWGDYRRVMMCRELIRET